MKRLLILPLCFVILVAGIRSAQCQISIHIVGEGPQTSQSCDGNLSIDFDGIGEVSGLNPLMNFPGFTLDFASTATSAYVDNMCSDTYYGALFEVENDSCTPLFVGQVLSGLDAIGVSSLGVQESIDVLIECEKPTTEFSADGSIVITSSDLNNADIDYLLNDYPNPGSPPIVITMFLGTDSVGTGMSINGLNSGSYLIRIEFPDEDHIIIGVVLEPENIQGCSNDSIYLIPAVYPASDNVVCDGGVFVSAWGTVGPYGFSHSSGTQGASDTMLCDGLYSVTVTDQALNSVSGNYIVPAMENVVNSVNWPFDPTLDSLFAVASANCDLDFTLPIDSVFIEEVYLIDSLQCQAVWRFYQGGEVFSITQDYAYDTQGPNIFTLGVYCENGRAELGYYFAVDEYDFTDAGTLSVTETNIDSQFSIAPNPSNGLVLLNTKVTEQIDLILYDAAGRLKLQKTLNGGNSYQLDLTAYPVGIYIMELRTSEGVAFKKVVKQ